MSRTTLLIGGNSGIGPATARALLQRGDQVIALIAFLLSDASRSLGGQILRADGGLSSLRSCS